MYQYCYVYSIIISEMLECCGVCGVEVSLFPLKLPQPLMTAGGFVRN